MTKKKKQVEEKKNNYIKNIAILISISILTKILVFFLTPNLFHSFIDTWDYHVYFETLVIPFTQGKLPYLDYNWEYPILMLIPVAIAAIPTIALKSQDLFFTIFPILMIICDLVTLCCVYFIALKIYNSSKRAFIAALLFATAFSAAYFVMTKYDAFPTCLLMVGLTFTIYGKNFEGYLATILGFFTKIYPVVILPFIFFYNSKTTSLKQEAISVAKILIPAALILAIPTLIMNPSSISVYFLQTEMGKDFFVNTFTYTAYSWLHAVVDIPITTVSAIMYAIMITSLLFLVYLAYSYPQKSPRFLLELSICAIFSLVVFTKFHSPQYMMWFTPLLCILVAGDFLKIGLFYLTQALAFIEFPLVWRTLYTNTSYTSPLSAPLGQLTLVFFTFEYLVLFYLVWSVIEHKDLSYLKGSNK